jgi:predicted ATPase
MPRRTPKAKRDRTSDPSSGVFLRSIAIDHSGHETDTFPFSVPVVRALRRLEFPTAVTFLVGENGSGKSTLLEAIAAATSLPTVGSESTESDATMAPARALASTVRLTWDSRPQTGFFLRAEDFFGFVKRVSQMRSEMAREIEAVTAQYASEDRSRHALVLRLGPLSASLADMERRYGVDLDAHSHGESFLELFQSRFVPGGLYLLDEPEAPLSPQSQLALIAMIGDMVAARAQFIIATHSPILLAFPGATIYAFHGGITTTVPYAELEHVKLTRDFLADPARFLHYLLNR